MCGIAACFAYHEAAPPVDRSALADMCTAMARRGPDGAGAWASDHGRAALGHRRLAIIDLSEAAAQPMTLDANAEGGTLAISFNGEIYNYRELRSALAERGCRFRTTSDTEVLLHLYREYGPEMVHLLRGMFAFALWDGVKQQLVLARDPFGIKPLYFADDGRSLWAASQVKPLRRLPGMTARPDPAGHVGFLLWGHVPEPLTLYRDIRSLPAGTALTIQRGGERTLWRYFDPARTLAVAEALGEDIEDADALVAQGLRESVKRHLVSDTLVGIFLSSGVDSTVIAALAARLAPTPLTAITLAFREFEGTAADEAPLAAETAGIFGFKHHTRMLSRDEFLADLDGFLEAMDQPTIDGVNTYFVSKAARECGLKVALSGTGGDEISGGYPSFRQIPLAVRRLSALNALPVGLRDAVGAGFRRLVAPALRGRASAKYASLLEFGSSYAGAYLLRRGLFMPWELPTIIDADLAAAGWQELGGLASVETLCDQVKRPHAKVTACELSIYLRDQLLRQTDWAAMAHSVEVRVPFVDAELFRSLAPLLVSDRPPSKAILAQSGGPELASWLAGRPKTGFSVPFARWLREREGEGDHRSGEFRSWAKQVYAQALRPVSA